LLVIYAAFAALLTWAGHLATRNRKGVAASRAKWAVLTLATGVLLAVGLWFTNIVAYRIWAAGGPDPAHKEAHLFWASWALGIASVSFLGAGIAWPIRRGAKSV
jgi:hypothetical protein